MVSNRLRKSPEEEGQTRKALAVEACQRLSKSADFMLLFKYLKDRYPLNTPAFIPGHEMNTHAAAVRDGEKNVVRLLSRMLDAPTAEEIEDGDAAPRPTRAVSEFTPPTL